MLEPRRTINQKALLLQYIVHSSQQNNALTVKVHSAIFTFYLEYLNCFCSITYILWLWHQLNYRCKDRSRKVQEKSGLGPRRAWQDRAGEGGDQVPVWESEAPEGQGGQWQSPGLEGLRQYQERENGGMQRAQGSQVGNFARSQCFSGILYLEFEDNVVFWQLIKFLVQWFLITPNSLLFWFVAKL